MNTQIDFTTERLQLREFLPDDWRAVSHYAVLPEVYRFMPWGPNSEHETQQFIQQAIAAQQASPRHVFEVAIIERHSNHLIGGCNLKIHAHLDATGEVGYCLSPSSWGKGYATETAQSLIAFGFSALDLHRIYAEVDPENHASRRVCERLKLRNEGCLREYKQIHGEWRDTFMYAILAHEWHE